MWRTVRLGEACLVRRGTTITKKQTVGGEVPVIGGGTKPTYFHNEPNRAANCITVSGSGASAGFVNKWEVPIFASDCSTVEPKDGTQLPQFVYYYLMSQQQFIYENFRSGAAQPHVYAKDIETLDYPIVSLTEQQHIVAKLDAAFAEIDRAVERNEEKLEQANLLRQSAIDKLIASNNSEPISLSDAIAIKHGFAFRSEFFDSEGEMVLLTPGNFEETGGFRNRGEKQKYYVGECPDEFILNGGELLVAMTEQAKGLLGSALIVPKEGKFLHNQRLGRIEPKQELSLAWLFHYFNTSSVREELHRTGTGVKVRHTSPAKIGNLKIKVPSHEEQEKIAKTLDAVLVEHRRLISLFQNKSDSLIALKSAILSQELQPPQSEAA